MKILFIFLIFEKKIFFEKIFSIIIHSIIFKLDLLLHKNKKVFFNINDMK
jgi:predicted transglutaminase-like protease